MRKKNQSKVSWQKLLNWLDNHLLFSLSGLLLVCIPLFPKIPLYSPIEEYIVRIRAEDFLVLVTLLVWSIQVFRKKIKWNSTLAWFIFAYALAGLLSVISALFVLKTIPFTSDHLLKTVFHYLRYLEYFALFFIFYGSVNSAGTLLNFLKIASLSLLGVGIYGIGQKYYYWPVYSTMNREFSKGIRLYLTEHARVQSTFAGHYDLAAYLVIVLPILLAFAYSSTKKRVKLALFSLQFLGMWLLIMSAARTSFIAYLLASAIVIILFGLKKQTLRRKISWIFSRFLGLWSLILILMIGFGDDIYERSLQVLKSYPKIYANYQQLEKQAQNSTLALTSFFQFKSTPLKLDPTPPPNSISTAQAAILVASDERPISQRPIDVYTDIPDKITTASISADGSTQTITIEKPRVWSDNALQYGLSMAIRLDTLWPRAIQGFLRSPLLGSGYATLNKTSVNDFTIADSTDNNFLRTLGETGLLGLLTFYGTIFAAMLIAIKSSGSQDLLLVTLGIAYFAAAIGLLFNAIYIDVFAASKVAFMFWTATGLFLGYYELKK